MDSDVDTRRVMAAEEFERHERRDGRPLVLSLASGLTLLRDTFYARIHEDVVRRVGMDSMLSPLSQEKTERMTKLEIEIYQIVTSSLAAAQRGYVGQDADWYLAWLARFRLGHMRPDGRVAQRLVYYRDKTPDERRLAFSNVLLAALGESRRAPLVLFRLLPPAVEIVTALAFGKEEDACDRRDEQVDLLPAIRDCSACRGGVLDNGEQCSLCGNPLWTFDWLTAVD